MSASQRAGQPILLALDTSTRTVGLAVYNGAQVLGELIWTSLDYHTVELAPAVEELLGRVKVAAKDLAVLGVALGPGSFTGLRIGLAFAKGLALARNIPLIGIPTFDILAVAQHPAFGELEAGFRLAVVLQAGRGRLAVGWYGYAEGGWQANAEIEAVTLDELIERIQTPTIICGELGREERETLRRARGRKQGGKIALASPAASLRRPSYLAELAWQRWQTGQRYDPATLAPIYLHYNDPIPG